MSRISFHRGILSVGTKLRLEVHLLLFPLVFAAWLGDYLALFGYSWLFALLHECCHVLIGHRMGIAVASVRLLPFGVCATLKHPVIKEPFKEILMALAGPICNLLLYGIFILLRMWFSNTLLDYAILANLSMALLNLLPCLPLDGGRILRALLTLGSNAISAWRISVTVSRFLGILLILLGIGLLLASKFNFQLLMIGVFLLGNLCTEQKSITRQTLENLLHYNSKLDQDNLNRTLVLTADASLPARRLLRKLSYHRYCLVHVVNEQQQVIHTLTEREILNALLHQSIRITLGDLCTKNT